MTFFLHYPKNKNDRTAFFRRYGLNGIYSGKHWSARRKDAEDWHMFVISELKRQEIPKKCFSDPVKISFYWADNLDIDNHALMGKMTVDALKGYLLENDSKRYFSEVCHKYWDGKCIKIEIEKSE